MARGDQWMIIDIAGTSYPFAADLYSISSHTRLKLKSEIRKRNLELEIFSIFILE